MTKILLQVDGLKKIFLHKNGDIKLFNNVNLKVKKGDLIALVGPSGSGKSSFLHLLALLDEPSQGKIFLNNQDTKYLSDDQKNELRRNVISIIFQENNLLSDFTALENVMMPLIINEEKNSSSIKKAAKILKEVKIFNRMNHFPNELSGGEQQRVAIARALVSFPKILIADEPTGNLDKKNSEEVINLIFKLQEEQGSSLIIVTHDQSIASQCSKTIKLDNGLIV